jgi:hypothetical protein
MQGSKVVDENPQFVQMTSDLRIPENTRCAMQQSPWPIMSKKIEIKVKTKNINRTYLQRQIAVQHIMSKISKLNDNCSRSIIVQHIKTQTSKR